MSTPDRPLPAAQEPAHSIYSAPRTALIDQDDTPGPAAALLDYQARIGRLRYLARTWISAGIVLASSLLPVALGGKTPAIVLVAAVLGVVAMVYNLILEIQRLHDLDSSGWWALLSFVPVANIVLFIVLALRGGSRHANRFGPPPPSNPPGVVLAGFTAVIGLPLLAFFTSIIGSGHSIW